LPEQTVPSWAIAIRGSSADRIAERLRLGTPAVFPRVQEDAVLVDLRTVSPEDDDVLSKRLVDCVAPSQ
jgi:L-seryl-tRNA(Ser) seleniumtransferase